jgi:SAM-dependent methyltransferase
VASANQDQHDYWNREESRHWVEQQRRYDEMLEPFGNAMLTAAGVAPDHRVLDIGCGNGMTTRAAARVASKGHALGVDLSQGMVARAQELASEEGVENVSFEVDDAQTRSFDPEFDRAISRFGVMFFDDPAGAFANIRSALRDDGQATFVVWQELFANEWLTVPSAGLLQHVELPEMGEPGGPGPFGLADPDRVRNIFTEAGFADLAIEPFEGSMLLGGRGTLDEAVDFLTHTGIAEGMLKDVTAEVRALAVQAARDSLEPYLTDEGVRIGGAAWIVSARR